MGKIPVTNFITLESNEDQWMMLIRGFINELKTTGVIEKEPGEKVRIKLIINKIIPPYHVSMETYCKTVTESGENISIGLSKSTQFLNNFINKTRWSFIGYIDSQDQTPIFITYYESLKMFIYTVNPKEKKVPNFFPQMN